MVKYELVLTVVDEGGGVYSYAVIEGNEDNAAVLADGEHDSEENAVAAGMAALKEVLQLANN